MQLEFVNLYLFLYQLCETINLKVVSTMLKCNPDFCLIIIQSFLNLPPIPRIRSAERIRGIGGNF